jgi:hypothetical protein
MKVRLLLLEESFHPEVLYSTERENLLNCGYPFFPGLLALQLAKKRWIALMARSAEA